MARSRKAPPTDTPPAAIRGNIDRVSAEGVLFGWCLDEAMPQRRVQVTIFADGEEIGTAVAASFRQDLMDAGVGNGQHGFTFTLPINVLRRQRVSTFSAADTESGITLGGALTWRAEASTTFDDRLARLETDLRILGDRMQVTTSSDASIAMLFDAVGTFFARLGQDLRDGRASADGMGLADKVDVVAANFADIVLPIPATPRFALLLTASASADVLHARLSDIARTRLAESADVFLLDDSSDVTIALLPAVIRNLRYIRVRGDPVMERASLIRMLHHEIIICIDARLPVTPAWIDTLADALLARDSTGLIGMSLTTNAENLGDPAKPLATSVRAINAAAFAVRGAALQDADGLDFRYDNLDIAVIDLCYRLRAAGWAIDSLPVPDGWHATLPTHASGSERRRSTALLEQSWPMVGRPDELRGTAACILTTHSNVDQLVTAVDLLGRAGYTPLILSSVPRADAAVIEAQLLQSHVETIWCTDVGAATALLASGFQNISLVCLPTADDVAELKPGMVEAGINSDIMAVPAMLHWLQDDVASRMQPSQGSHRAAS